MSLILFILQILFLCLFILLVVKGIIALSTTIAKDTTQEEKLDLGYRKRRSFMNSSEATFFHMFVKELPQDFYIFPKTRVADVVETLNGNGYYHRRNKVLPRHVDFLICNPQLEPVMAIEIDGASHNSPDRIERDHEMDEIFSSVGIPLKHVKVGTSFDIACKTFVEELCGTTAQADPATSHPSLHS